MEDIGDTVSGFKQKLGFYSKIPVLNNATSDEEVPTPGYLYKEITKVSYEDGQCQALMEYLLNRLQTRSYHVKLKVLRIMHYLVEHGHQDFSAGLRKSSSEIQRAQSFNGPPDPLHGNTPYIMVRKAAKDLSQILFDTESQNTSKKPLQPITSLRGIDTVGMGVSSRPGQMQGFGNSPVKQTGSLGDSLLSGIKDFVDKVSDQGPSKPEYSLTADTDRQFGQYVAVTEHDTEVSEVVDQILETDHVSGASGENWGSVQNKEYRSSSDGSMGLEERLESVSIGDWSNEIQLVQDFTQPTLKRIPSRNELSSFIKSCSSLNCDKIMEVLNCKLQSSEEVTLMRSLLILESLMRVDLISIDQLTNVFHVNLLTLYQKRTDAVHAKARKILRQLEKLSCCELIQEMIPGT